MPALKSWFPRTMLIIQAIESGAESLTRHDVERLFEISRSQADTLMGAAGAAMQTVDGVRCKVVTRSQMLDYLKFSHEGQTAIKEDERRKQLAHKLNVAVQEQKWRSTRIVADRADSRTMARDLELSGITFSPGEMKISYSSFVDMLHKLWCLAMAIGNEPERFEEACEQEKSRKVSA